VSFIRFSRLVCGILLIAGSVNLVQAQGFLRASGTKIVNDNGDVLLRGMGLGGWLVPEGYMMGTSAFANSPSQIRSKIEAVAGKENRIKFYKEFEKNFFTRADMDTLKQWGFNSVRLPFHYANLTPPDSPGVWLEPGFAVFVSVIAWGKANQMYVILDMHCAPGAQNGEPISDSDGQARLWQESRHRDRTVAIWRKIAERYKDEPWVGGYDLINEPAWDLGSGNKPLRELYIRLTDTIRVVDKNHILFFEGNWFATDFSGLQPKWDDNMVYSFHRYWADNSSSAIQYLLTLRNTEKVPLWCGESGENSNTWFTNMIRTFEFAQIGWSWWTIKKIESVVGLWNVKQDPGFATLIKYWSGTGSKPSESNALVSLMNQAANYKLANCRVQRDVLNAMFTQIRTPKLSPFVPHSLPGRVYVADFDFGYQNQAYFDSDYQNINGAGGGTWNTGWIYRNDGVDIEACKDALAHTNGFNVGWTANSEWMKYSVNVEKSGTYDILIRHASQGTGGSVSLYSESTALVTGQTLASSGGWQIWKTTTVPGIHLNAGPQVLKFLINTGGANLNYLEFVLKTADSVEETEQPVKFGLEAPYPNPFNPSAQISFTLDKAGPAELTVYSVLGQKIRVLASGSFPAGRQTVRLDGSDLASGTYLIRLKSGSGVQTRSIQLVK